MDGEDSGGASVSGWLSGIKLHDRELLCYDDVVINDQMNFKHQKNLLYARMEKAKRKKWDQKWRVVIFDVWENTREKRDALRYEIKNFGFIQLQRSVWIYPYECADFIELLKMNLSFGKNIRYMIVEKLDHDDKLKKYFKIR